MKSKIHVFSRIFTKKLTELVKVNLLLFILFAVFAVPSVWAQLYDYPITYNGEGIITPCTGSYGVHIDPSHPEVTTFDLHDDDGGDGGYYSNNCNGKRVITAPKGYGIKVSGWVMAETVDYLQITNGLSTTEVIANVKGSGVDTQKNFGPYYSTGNEMTVSFITDASVVGPGLLLHVEIVPLRTVTIQENPMSTQTANMVIWRPYYNVSYGYSYSEKSVSFPQGMKVSLGFSRSWQKQYLWGLNVKNLVTGELLDVTTVADSMLFTLPAGDVVVMPTYRTDDIFKMAKGQKTIELSSNSSITLYDDGGADYHYANNFDGYVTVVAPEDQQVMVSGTVKTEKANDGNIYDYLEIFEGEKGASTTPKCKFYSKVNKEVVNIGSDECVSDGRKMTFHFHSDYSDTASGLELTVSAVGLTHSISLIQTSNGTIESDVSSARTGTLVTLTATPNSGFILKDVRVVNTKTKEVVATSGGWETNNKVTFTMPQGDVEVTPTFVTNTYSILRDPATSGGSISGASAATVGSRVSLTANPSTGYLFKGVSVVDANGNPLSVSGGNGFLDRTFSFTMPIGNVTVTPSFTNNLTADGGLYIDMPTTGTVNATIPSGVKSFKIYDDGGKDGSYSNNSSGTLVLTAPSGYILQLSGSVNTYKNSSNVYDTEDYLTICDGGDTTKPKLVNKKYGSSSSIGKVYSNGQSMTLYFHSNGYNNASGLDLTVTLVKLALDLVDDGNGGQYVNMLPNNVATLDIPSGVTSFKVYDDGGKSGNYSNSSSGTLVLKAPSDHVLRLSGSVNTYWNSSSLYDTEDYLTVCDGADTTKAKLVNKVYGLDYGSSSIGTVYSRGQYMTLYFHSNGIRDASGLDLTVAVIPVENQITYVNANSGGSILSSSSMKAKIDSTASFTYDYNSGYLVSDIKVVAESGEAVKAVGGWYNNKKASFKMPHSGVTVTSTYTNNLTADGGLYIDMPTTGTVNATIPSGVTSFKIYDDGGKNGYYSNNSSGTLVLTAPSGYFLELTGSVNTHYRNSYINSGYDTDDYLTVCDGADTTKNKLVNKTYGMNYGIGSHSSSGRSMTLYFHSNGSDVSAGLDLSVRVISAELRSITINDVPHGSVESDMSRARVGSVVTLTANSDDGYLLKSISVTDENGNSIGVFDPWSTSNLTKISKTFTYSFVMPESPVIVKPVFTNKLTADDGLYFKMPDRGLLDVTIPNVVKSFKVKGCNVYSDYCNGVLALSAPEGYRFKLEGKIDLLCTGDDSFSSSECATIGNQNYFSAFDGLDTTIATKLLNEQYSPINGSILSSGRFVSLYLYTGFTNYKADAVDLTVTLVPNIYTITVIPVENGSVRNIASKKEVDDKVRFSVAANTNYMLSDLVVEDASQSRVKVNGGWYSKDAMDFTMPASDVTITPVFTNSFTAAGGLHIDMAHGKIEAEIPREVQSFKVYDNGGKNGNYDNNSRDTLVLKAPDGFRMRLTGSMVTESSVDVLHVYDGDNTNATQLYTNSGSISNVSVSKEILSSGAYMTIFFKSNPSISRSGLDLTVTLEQANYIISVNNVPGGTLSSSKSADTLGAEIILTGLPSGSNRLSGVSVIDKNNHAVWAPIYSFDYSKFVMPASNVTVTPSWTSDLTAEGGLHLDMVKNGNVNVSIPRGVKSFKLYDNGGKDNVYGSNSSDTLTLTAPNGYYLKVTGNISTQRVYDSLHVYNGTAVDEKNELCGKSSSGNGTKTDVGTIASSGRSLTFRFNSNKTKEYDGLDLTVDVIPVEYNVTVVPPDNGRVESDKVKAAQNSLITLQWEGMTGYILREVDVKDISNNKIAVNGGWYSQFVTFSMPNSNVTVTPTFTNNLTATGDDGLYINMPKTGTINATIPEGVGSFKVYDEGGVNGAYSNNSDGSIVFTAPTGYLLKLTGTVIAERNYDKLYVYNGSAVNENNLMVTVSGKATGSSVNEKADVGTIVSSGERMTVRFTSDDSQYYSGLNLTMTLVKSIASMTVANVSSQTYTGTAICPEVVVKDGGTVLVKNTDYTVTCSDNINVGTATATITGIGVYTGTVSKQFTIIPKVVDDFAAVTIEQDENGTFAVIDGNYSGTDVVEIKNEIKDVPVVYNRSFPANAYSTIMLPFDVNTANIEGPDAVLRYNGIKDNSSIRMKVVWATEEWALANGITGKSYAHTDLSANTPYLVQMGDATSEDGKTVALKVNGAVTLKKTADTATAINGWKFRGTWQYKRWDANDDELGYAYGFAASASETNNIKVGDFVKVGVGAWIRPMRAYLVKDGITKKSAQLARANGAYVKRPTVVPEELPELMSIVIDSDDGNEERTTVIGHFNTRTGEIKMNYDRGKFDLKGRRVNGSNNARGAYYGKKILKK